MKIVLSPNTRTILLPSVIVLLVSFLLYTFVYPWILYRLYYPQEVQAVATVDFPFIEGELGEIWVAVSDETHVVKVSLDGKLLQIEKDLSSFTFSGRVLRLVDGDGEALKGFQYDSTQKGRDSIRFTGAGESYIEFKFYDDLFIIRSDRSTLGALQVTNAYIHTKDGQISVWSVVTPASASVENLSGTTKKPYFAPLYQIGGVYVDGVFEKTKTSRDTEITRVFQEIAAADDRTKDTKNTSFVPTSGEPKYSFSLVDNYYRLGALSMTIPEGDRQEIRIVHSFKRSLGSDSYLSSDTFQWDQNAVDEILKMGGLDFIKGNTFFYDDHAKVGYVDYSMKKFVELKLKSEQPVYVGKRGSEIIYQGKEDTYVYTLKPNEQAKIKENVYITKKRKNNVYTYEILGNYQLEKHADGSIALLGQNLNKAGLTETCSDEYYTQEQTKRLNDIKTLKTADLLKKYGKTSTGEIDTTEFCVSPQILTEKKKAVPYDVPVFHLEKPMILDASGNELIVPINVWVAGREVTYSFDAMSLSADQFPIRFDPTLTTDAELQNADHTNMRISGGTGLGTEPSGGPLGEWTAGTSMGTARSEHWTAIYNGYIYAVGGSNWNALGSVEYALINSNGSIGAWFSAGNSLWTARSGLSSFAYNGYIYAIGGRNSSNNTLASVEYALINSNWSLGSWNTTTNLSTARESFGLAHYNGYVYAIAGYNNVTGRVSSVEYAPINSNGTLGSWATTASLLGVRSTHGAVVYNGYIYVVWGANAGGQISTVEYAPINSNGTLGTWTATTSMNSTRAYLWLGVYNGYIYAIGWQTWITGIVTLNSTEYAPINSNGTLGTWVMSSNMISDRERSWVIAYNGYIYVTGGTPGGAALNTTEYARIQPVGGIGNWTANPTKPIEPRTAFWTVVYNWFVYLIGWMQQSDIDIPMVEYAPINSNGTIWTWVSTSSLQKGRRGLGAVVYNGYIYALGWATDDPEGYTNTVERAQIQSAWNLWWWSIVSSFSTRRGFHAVAEYNWYIYVIGGIDQNNSSLISIEYAPIDASGVIGSWSSNTELSSPTRKVVVYNGYMYAVGWSSWTVEYSLINSNGILWTWNSTTAMIIAREDCGLFAYNWYIYAIWGDWSLNGRTSEYAKINTNGTIAIWTLSTSLQRSRSWHGLIAYNGFIYTILWSNGGTTGMTQIWWYTEAIEYAPIANNLGTLGSWGTTTGMTTARQWHWSLAYNGYIYSVGWFNASVIPLSTTEYASINSNGTIGTWTGATNMTTQRVYFGIAVYNGFIYAIGWNTAWTNSFSTTEYAQINWDGSLWPWNIASGMVKTRRDVWVAVYNGYIYAVGWVENGQTTPVNTSEYAIINANGTLWTWALTSGMYTPRWNHGVAVYNGYLYAIGGDNITNLTTEFAPINLDGTIWTWSLTTVLSIPRENHGVVIHKWYIYAIWGDTGNDTHKLFSTEYAPIRTDGTLWDWMSTTRVLTARNEISTSVSIYNDYIYIVWGKTWVTFAVSTVEYASINNIAGKLGNVTSTTNGTICGAPSMGASKISSTAYNGKLYVIGRCSDGMIDRMYLDVATINANGSLSTWIWPSEISSIWWFSPDKIFTYNGYIYGLQGNLWWSAELFYAPINSMWDPVANATSPSVPLSAMIPYNGYLYSIWWMNGLTHVNTVQYAPISSDGSVGAWINTNSISTPSKWIGVTAYNGYLYAIWWAIIWWFLNSVEYAPINSDGSLWVWNTTTQLPIETDFGNNSVYAYNGYIYALGSQSDWGTVNRSFYAPINSNGTISEWNQTTAIPAMVGGPNISNAMYNGYVYSVFVGNETTPTRNTYYAPILHTPQSSIQQLWHKTYDKGSATTDSVYVSLKYNTQIDNDTMIRYRLWNGSGTTALYRSQWIPLESYKSGIAERKIFLPTHGHSFQYFDFEIMRVSSSTKTENNIISISYGLVSGTNNCLACTGADVVIDDLCIVDTEVVCHLNDIEITGSGILEVRPPGNLNFDSINHNILIRNLGKVVVKNNSKIYYDRVYTYDWNTSDWESCTALCGGGTQARSVFCLRDDGTPVDDSFCTETKPAISQACNTQSCWVNGVCDTSTNFACTAGTSINNNAGSCGGSATWTCAGAGWGTSASCTKPNPACVPVNCSFTTYEWSSCSVTCGGGNRDVRYTITTPASNGGTCSVTEGQFIWWTGSACNTQVCPAPTCSTTAYQCTVGTPSNLRDNGCGSTKNWRCNSGGSYVNCSVANPACVPIDCSYSTYEWSSCSVTCGWGRRDVYYYKTVWESGWGTCDISEDEFVGWVGSACNTQACCTSSSYSACYNGNRWWYDSCGNREWSIRETCYYWCGWDSCTPPPNCNTQAVSWWNCGGTALWPTVSWWAWGTLTPWVPTWWGIAPNTNPWYAGNAVVWCNNGTWGVAPINCVSTAPQTISRVLYGYCYWGTNGTCSHTHSLSSHLPPWASLLSVTVRDFGIANYPDWQWYPGTSCNHRMSEYIWAATLNAGNPSVYNTSWGSKRIQLQATVDIWSQSLEVWSDTDGWWDCGGTTCWWCLDNVEVDITYQP